MASTQSARYRVGCAGMFVLGTDYEFEGTEDEVILECDGGPPGCEAFNVATGEWIAPACPEDVEQARARLAR